jgi:uncharacterized membrane protein YczE
MLYRRLFVYTAGLLVYSLGACLMVTAHVGISPLTSVAYILSYITPFSLGITQLVFNVFLVLLQVLILRKDFHPYEYLQLAASVAFSVFIDLLMLVIRNLHTDLLPLRCLIFGGAMICMSLGITFMLLADFVMLPGDGLPKVIARLTKWPFGTAKIVSDSLCAIATMLISLIALGRIEGVQAGTVAAALILGSLARFFIKTFGGTVKAFLFGTESQSNRSAV